MSDDFTTTPNYGLFKPTVDADVDVWGDHLNANADTLDALIRTIDLRTSGAVFLVTDYLDPGQPDGTTDNTAQVQNAINDAAGVAQLLFTSNAHPYVVGTLNIPSNSYITIASGATLLLKPNTNNHMLLLATNATDILIELYGTLDGNVSNQPGTATPGVNSGGIVSSAMVSNAFIIGNKTGLITNFSWSPIDLQRATNCEVSGVSMISCASVRGGSAGIAGNIQRPNATSTTGADKPRITSGGSLVGATGVVTLTTNMAHGFVPGQEISPICLVGTGAIGNAGAPGDPTTAAGISNGTGTGAIFVTLPGTTGTTVKYQANAGGADATINDGFFDIWATAPVATIASGSFGTVITSGGSNTLVTLTTTAPHGLVPDQVAIINITTGTVTSGSAVSASGVFVLAAGTGGSTIVYVCPLAGFTAGAITGIAGTVAVSTKSYDSGFSDCYLDNVNDIAIALYGGCENCYVRNCEISRSNAGAAIFSDRNSGRSIACEISGCYIHDNYSTGVYASVASADSLHLNCRIHNNLVANCVRGAALSNIDGIDFYNNRLYANKSSAITPGSFAAAELSVGQTASRANIFGNVIRDAGGGGAAGTILIPITAGTYNSTTGDVSLTRGTGTNLFTGCIVTVSGLSGSGAVASLNGMWTCTAGTNGTTTVNFRGPAGLGAITISAGSVWPSVFGILLYLPPQCRILGNSIGDYQPVKTMAAAIGGLWGGQGFSGANYYGPQFFTGGNFPADQSVYQSQSVQGISYHTATGYTSGLTMGQGFTATTLPPVGLTMGRNLTVGRGELDFYVGAGQAAPGGFDFIKVTAIYAASGSYTSGTGAVSVTTNLPHGLAVGTTFRLAAALGTGADIGNLNGTWIATTGTAGTALNFTLTQVVSGVVTPWTGLNITSITGGIVNASTTDGGVIDSSVGVPVVNAAGATLAVGGSLLANDGLGNTRLGGALVHGAMQTATLVNAGTVTVNPNTSLVLVQNASSIATGSVVLPAPTAYSYQLGGAGLEIRFQNAVGALTMTAAAGASVAGPPMAVLSGGSSFRFVLSEPGNVWLPCIADVSGTPPVGGPYLALSGGGVTGPTTFSGTTTLSGTTTASGVLNYTATGATTSRAAQDRAAAVINVKDYGAVGDGVTVDHVAIIAAINAANASATAKTVYFPPGTYMCGTFIPLQSGITLWATPGTATIKATATNAQTPLLLRAEAGSHNDILIYGLVLDGNYAGQTGGGGALNKHYVNGVINSTRIVWDHCRFQNCVGEGLQMNNSVSHSGVRDCTFDNIGMYHTITHLFADCHQAIVIQDSTLGNSTGNFVENCHFTNIGSDCVDFGNQFGASFRNNRAFLNNLQYAGGGAGCAMLFDIASRGTTIIGNVCWQASGNSFDLAGCTLMSIVGNESYNAGVNGISIGTGAIYGISTGSLHGVISGNLIMNSGQDLAASGWIGGCAGLAFTTGAGTAGPITDFVVTGNTFSDNQVTPTQTYGIAAINAGSGLPTITRLVIALSNHMNGNVTAPFGGGLGYSTAEGALTVSGAVVATTGLRVNGNAGFNSTAPIAQPTGWGTSTGGARGAITASATLPQVATALAQLLTDLKAYGLIGT